MKIKSDYIELGKFLKFINVISTGGLSKPFLLENKVLVNNSLEQRRGRKLYDGDVINIKGKTYLLNNH
ncbi:RNA-binding S4 domain-containing protein [Mycoplasmoides pirum]|uniref:RNA-binding S4 domain-containing protein n=1 Tax=Mycoplasmoides pirum TaxID=2122 RepID=UPI001FD4D9F5|nr:RNA-binding S4 domain-containing protein [Mycoplasmoides pirum]